jgi:glycosyl transferase family 25
MWEFVDKFIYINLDSRQDRRDIMKKFFEEGKIPSEKIERFQAIRREKAEIGCLESHTEVLRIAKRNGWKNVLILEDDMEWLNFHTGYKNLEELMQLDWNVILLVGWYITYDFPRIYSSRNAGAYLVNSAYYDTLLENREKALSHLKQKRFGFTIDTKIYAADYSWSQLQKKDNWYGIFPCMCRQVDGFSDHCKTHIEASLIHGIANPETAKRVYNITMK